MSNTPEPQGGRIKQFAQAYRMTRQTDRWIPLWLLLSFLVGAAVGAGIFWVVPPRGGIFEIVMTVVGGLLFGLLAMLIVFSRRAQKAVYTQMDGRVGAGAATLQGTLRRGWVTETAVAFTRQQDVVHRVVGPPGIVLIGEGNPHRLRPLMTNERRKLERVVSDVPVHEIVVGHGEGQTPLKALNRTVVKLPRAIKPAEQTDVRSRLKAFDAQRSNIPLPKGPVPTSMKGLRGNLRGR